MLVVRPEYQKLGYMRKMMEYTYRLAENRGVSVILDTDDKDYKEYGRRELILSISDINRRRV